MTCNEFKNGWSVSFERLFPSGMYMTIVRDGRGEVHDKMRCDDYRTAREYHRAFKAIAKAA